MCVGRADPGAPHRNDHQAASHYPTKGDEGKLPLGGEAVTVLKAVTDEVFQGQDWEAGSFVW